MALHLPSHLIQSSAASPVLSLCLNAEGTLFGSAETGGWRIWDTRTLQLVAEAGPGSGSYNLALPFYRSNIVFLVGGLSSPRYAPNQLCVWDEELGRVIFELDFADDIRGIAARYDRLVIVLSKRVFVFAIGSGQDALWQEATYETAPNPKGLLALSTDLQSTLLAFPGRQAGHVQIIRLPPLSRSPLLDVKGKGRAGFPAVAIIIAHTSALSAMCCTPSGSLLATASTKGTLVRLWDAASSQLVRELRRGTDPAEIFSLALRPDGGALAVSSDKGTVHVWELARTEEKPKPNASTEPGKRLSLSTLKPYLPKYFSSEWSHSQFRLPPPAVPLTRFSSVPDEAATIEDDVCTCLWLPTANDVDDLRLHLLTQSGGSFRLALEPRPDSEEVRSSSTVPQAWGASGNLRLEEYKRWGSDELWD